MIVKDHKKHKGEILLVNGSKQCSKGRPKNFLNDTHVAALSDAYLKWKPHKELSVVIKTEDAIKNDYNLSPSRYIAADGEEEVASLDEAVVLLREAEEERKSADSALRKVLTSLGFEVRQ